MSYLTAIPDLRVFLSDNDKDKLFWRKRCIGSPDGSNKRFKTFEFRRLTDFTTSVSPYLVFVDGVAATVDTDSTESGDFILHTAPAQAAVVEATYYTHWFLDTELIVFLTQAMNWLGFGDDYTKTAGGLVPALQEYASHLAYKKLALRWAVHLSETYRLEDASDDQSFKIVDTYNKASSDALKNAETKRKSFYTRQDQAEAPLFRSVAGVVFDVPPNT